MENMITHYGKHRIWSKTIAMAVVCLFSVNTLCWAYPDSQPASNKNVLATQSVFKPLINAGIQDSAELVFEILAGIRLLHAGKTYSAVNGILAETYRNTQDKRKIEFFPDVQMANGQIIAKFKVIGREDLAFEIRYQDVRANIRPEITGETGNDVTVKDAGFYEIAPVDNLTYKNVFQESDSIVITKLSSAISQSAIARAPPDGVAPVTKVLLAIVDKAGSSLDFPTGLYALKSYLELNYREKCIVVIKDAQLEDLEDIANFTADWSPHILGLSLMTDTSKKLDKFMASLTSLLTSKDKPLLVFGKNVSTFAPSELLKKYPQAVCVKGEGELSLSGLLQYVRGEKRLSEVPNIAYFKDGNLEESGREVLPNLASIGRIDYNTAQEYLSRGGNLWMETSRGCPWGNCTYCSTKGFWGTSIWRNKPIEVIIDELKTLEKLGAERVTFTDEEFFGYGMEGIEHAKKLALAIISSGIKMSFYINARADAICNKDDSPKEREMRIETLRLLQKAGLKIVFLGLESGSPSQLGRYAKNINLAEAEGAIGICKTLGIEMAIGWIMLEPLAKKEEILEDIDFIRRNDILRYLSSPLSQMRMYPTTSYLKMVRMEEEKLGRKLVGENIDVDNLTFQTIGYKYPDTGVIIKLMDKYSRDEYDFYNSIKWFMRFYPKAHEKEFAYIARSLEVLKEYQIDFLGILCRLSTTEIMNNERVENIYKEAVKRRRDLVKEIQKKLTIMTMRQSAKEF